jgi:gas vesicle protein
MNDRIWGFCFGFGVGIGLGILFAPKSGRQTRSLIRGQAADGAEYVARTSAEIRDRASDLVMEGAETIVQQGEAIKTAVKAGRVAYD